MSVVERSVCPYVTRIFEWREIGPEIVISSPSSAWRGKLWSFRASSNWQQTWEHPWRVLTSMHRLHDRRRRRRHHHHRCCRRRRLTSVSSQFSSSTSSSSRQWNVDGFFFQVRSSHHFLPFSRLTFLWTTSTCFSSLLIIFLFHRHFLTFSAKIVHKENV